MKYVSQQAVKKAFLIRFQNVRSRNILINGQCVHTKTVEGILKNLNAVMNVFMDLFQGTIFLIKLCETKAVI